MKKLLFLITILLSGQLAFSQNTFPATGNVGIGTTTPTNTLQIGPNPSGWAGNGLIVSNGNGGLAIANLIDHAYIFGSHAIALQPGGTVALWAGVNGNVGIGTNNPGSYRLNVAGHTKIGGNVQQANLRVEATDLSGSSAKAVGIELHGYESRAKGIYISDESDSHNWFVGEGYNYDGIGIGYSTSNQTEYSANTKFMVRTNGFVGIGATYPTNKFQIGNNVTGYTNNDFVVSNGNGSLAIHNNASDTYFYGNRAISIRPGGQVAIWAKENGNVGVGTTSPNTKLEVNGVARITDSYGFSIGNDPNQFRIQNYGVGQEFGFLNAGNAYAGIRVRATSIGLTYGGLVAPANGAIIQGNVGIGTSSPSEKLEVNGTIKTKKVTVTANGWPDYVFAPTYDLRSLNEVESFIRKNHHLPEVPSAKEVEKEGLDLGKMDATLLKKVEELTLYLIEVNKNQEKLIKEVEVLKKENAELKKKIGK